ncbi:hypothetical protein VNO77_22163 [Canavalia gladiata]|uniref:Uncharacterized protein n=1 Tax=Canavalia gladiata TaxID=3824 RepID=A0AAN9QAJ1_CANGL
MKTTSQSSPRNSNNGKEKEKVGEVKVHYCDKISDDSDEDFECLVDEVSGDSDDDIDFVLEIRSDYIKKQRPEQMQDVVGGSKPFPTRGTSEVAATELGEVPLNRTCEEFVVRPAKISVAGPTEVSLVGPIEVFVAGLSEAAADWPNGDGSSNISGTWK